MSVRITVVDNDGATSFVGPGYAIKMFVAACSKGPETLRELLDYTGRYDNGLVQSIRNGLAQFDEHNVADDPSAIEQEIAAKPADQLPPFRVYNGTTRSASSQPGRIGLIIFNLVARRIIQVQNSYSEIQRSDRGRIRRSGEPVRMLYHYSLPDEWALVP